MPEDVWGIQMLGTQRQVGVVLRGQGEGGRGVAGERRQVNNACASRERGGLVGDADGPTDSIEWPRSSVLPRSAEPTPTRFDRITSCSGAPRAAARRVAERRHKAVLMQMWAG
jgi:hypothetical protein